MKPFGSHPAINAANAKWLVLLSICLGAGCGKHESPGQTPSAPSLAAVRIPENKLDLPPDTSVPDGFSKLPPDAQREWLRGVWRRPLETAQTLKDRAELVRPRPPGFKSDGKTKSLKLTLIPLKTRLKPGESLWYRLQIQNIGTSSVTWTESNSFFKNGIHLGSEFLHIYLRLPDGREVQGMAVPLSFGHCPENVSSKRPVEASGVSEDDFKDMFTRATAISDAEEGLHLVLAPGETLSTRPWSYKNACFPKKPADTERTALSSGFREWPWDMNHAGPGTYGLRFEFSQPAPSAPPTEEEMAIYERKYGLSRADQLLAFSQRTKSSLGTYSSNSIQVVIAP